MNDMEKIKECNSKYWFTCSRCRQLLVEDLRAIFRRTKDN